MRKKNTILHNKFGREDLEKQLSQEEFKRTTLSFYKYVKIEDPISLRKELFIKWNELKVKGRIYIAMEGINAQLSCPSPNWDQFVNSVKSVKGFENIPFKIALEENKISFLKLVIKIKKQIVADGLNANEYDVTNVGSHLCAKEWNECINNGAIVVDVRNHYESRIGHFKDAIKPDVDTFREELPLIKEKLKNRKEEKILLYCTGGIRCEKTSSYLKHHGFKDVNQLHGGIIDYAKQIKEHNLENKFIGKNFVFDDRLGEKISNDIIGTCDQCGGPCDDYTNCNYVDCNLLFIQCKKCQTKYEGCCNSECKKMSKLPKIEQKKLRKVRKRPSLNSFKKSIRPKENITERNINN
ncbi:MAG: rhodanese-related sulfurtransferase [Flavobacteriales bacterium TMED191]|nr:MAG: rhodanese-related sulfurtransferase [Flavobacteriales bacterium TMED191]|tara:strand:+ start:547 stop:1605 length:1059 start_codon:yes stop_codon:yes gene_type:complete